MERLFGAKLKPFRPQLAQAFQHGDCHAYASPRILLDALGLRVAEKHHDHGATVDK
jgi:hypothetical protein